MSAPATTAITLGGHPRAAAAIRRARAWGGIVGLVLVALAGWSAGTPPFETGLRALGGGVAGYFVTWAVAVAVWRHLIVAEIRRTAERVAEARRRAAAARS